MTIWRRNHRSPEGDEPKTPAQTLAAECEAFIAGEYAQAWAGPPATLPAWVRLNEVAHAPLSQLEVVAKGGSNEPTETWQDVRALLARMLVEAAGHDEAAARRLQLAILQPLEARLGHVADFVTPRRLIEVVEASLIGFEQRDSNH